jgi:hypothetical protein
VVRSIKNEALSFVKGDNNAPWAILAETVIGCVPILGQVVDARDIIKGLVEVSGAPASPLAWFNLITALIGLIPGGGDAAKRALRSVKAGATQVDDLLAMIRRIYKVTRRPCCARCSIFPHCASPWTTSWPIHG